MQEEVKQIMLERLKEMAEINQGDFISGDGEACFNGLCSAMNDIASTLLQQVEPEQKEKSLEDYSTLELVKELATRENVRTNEEYERGCLGESSLVRYTLTITI